MSAAIIAFGAVSAMGEGASAVSAGVIGEPARVFVGRDEELAAAGLSRPFAARVTLEESTDDRATVLLSRALRGCLQELDQTSPGWRALRVGLAVGTSSGGMRTAERVFAACSRDGAPELTRDLAAGAFYFSPLLDAVRASGLEPSPATLVLGACAASTLAIGIGLRWLDEGACDLVLAGGFDAVSTFVAAGFETLRATTSCPPSRPFRVGRDGMSLGEGAAIVALRQSRLAPDAPAHVTGFGASSDAVHLTAPDRNGTGLAFAAKRALLESHITCPDLVSPHGSATPYSDAAEARALATAVPEVATDVVVHPFKAQVGHTLGASGALETLVCVDALVRGVLPAAAGRGEIDPDARVRLLDVTRAGSPRTALKLSAAFGGSNAALVVSRDRAAVADASHRRPVFLSAAVHATDLPRAADLAERLGWPIERVLRADPLTRRVLDAVALLVARDGPLSGTRTGIVVGAAVATLETNASFFARIEERGARSAEPRKFPYTSPNAAAGDASAAFGLTGPSFAVGSGLQAGIEALAVATTLVAAGDADALVVTAVDQVGPTVARLGDVLGFKASSGVVALLVSSDPKAALARVTCARSGIGAPPAGSPIACGHQALLPLLASSLPARLIASSPDFRHHDSPRAGARAWASVDLEPLQVARHGIDAASAGP